MTTGAVKWLGPTTAQIHNATLDVAKGYDRLQAMAARLNPLGLEHVERLAKETGLTERGAVILGTGELGLTVALALIQAKAVKGLAGFFHEQPAFLDNRSPSKASKNYFPIARCENALALKAFGEQHGVPVQVDDADLMIATGKGSRNDLPGGVADMVRAAGPNPLVFNTVAFARYKGPSSAELKHPAPQYSIDPKGRIILMDVPKFKEESFQETMNTMGYNDAALRDAFLKEGLIPEIGAAALVWDLPAFFSGALGAIPGGFSLYFTERKVLEDKGAFWGIHKLALEGLKATLGSGWVRRPPTQASWIFPTWPGGSRHSLVGLEPGIYLDAALGDSKIESEMGVVDWNQKHAPQANPVSFIQLDMNERVFAEEIKKNKAELVRRVDAYRASHPEATFPLSAEESEKILMTPYPVVPENYARIVGVLREPSSPADSERVPDTLPSEAVQKPSAVDAFFGELLSRENELGVTKVQEGDKTVFVSEVTLDPHKALKYAAATLKTWKADEDPPTVASAYTFALAFPNILDAVKPILREAARKTVIHAAEEIDIKGPILPSDKVTIRVWIDAVKKRGDTAMVFLNREIGNGTGIQATGRTTLIIGLDPKEMKPTAAKEKKEKEEGLSKSIKSTMRMTRQWIDEYADASGDHNPIHVSEEAAAELGFSSPIAHGALLMAVAANKTGFSGYRTTFRTPLQRDEAMEFEITDEKIVGTKIGPQGEKWTVIELGRK